ncbi:MAG: hypothetical protein ACHQKZ_08760 [Solirubrobacterales bacterium]
MKIEIEAVPQALAIVLILGAIGVGLWAYLARYPALSRRRRYILLGARILAILALLFASLAPVIRYPESSRARNRLLVLVDHSGSMQIQDASGGVSRRSAADSAAAAVAGALGGRYDVRVAAFDAALGPFGRDAAQATGAFAGGGETALGDAIRVALNRLDPDSVAALLVLSDGGVNRGEDPERALGGAIPAFGLTVGSASDPPTVGITGVEVPPEMIVGRATPFTVTVHQGDRARARGAVRVSEEGRELGRAPFALEGPGASMRVSIPVTVATRGKRFLTVELLEVADDPLKQNKRRLVAVDARPARRSVPLLATSWDWDLRSLARGVEEDTTWGVVRITPAGPSQVARLGAGASASFESFLEDAEAVVVRYDASTVTPDRAAALMRYLERGGGVLLWIDPRLQVPADSPLARAIHVVWRFWGEPLGPIATAELAPAGRTHEIALLGGDATSAAAIWKDLPPVEPLVALDATGSPLQPVVLGRIANGTLPLLLAGNVGKGRVVLLNASGVYRWGLTASGIAGRPGIEETFFGGICRWLAGGMQDRPVRIDAPDITPEGRPVPVRMTASLGPGPEGGATARVIARRVGGGAPAPGAVSVGATLTASGGGEFSGSIPLAPGIHVLRGRVDRGGRLLGADSIRIAVGVQGLEYETLAADPEALRRLAEGSGGMAAPLDSAATVLERLRSPDLTRVRLAEIDVFHNPILFLVLIGALAMEWALRRRFHLM